MQRRDSAGAVEREDRARPKEAATRRGPVDEAIAGLNQPAAWRGAIRPAEDMDRRERLGDRVNPEDRSMYWHRRSAGWNDHRAARGGAIQAAVIDFDELRDRVAAVGAGECDGKRAESKHAPFVGRQWV